MRAVIVVSAILLASCGPRTESSGENAPAAKAESTAASAADGSEPAVLDLAACPAREAIEKELRPRRGALPVPAALREVMRAGVDNIAVATLDGSTLCIDASWMNSINNAALSADGRFAAFDWHGYEAFGHLIVDRTGKGATLETGVEPVASPSGRLLAAADLSESGYGALNAFAVWWVEPAGWRRLGQQDVVPPAVDWRIERWSGEDCIELSAIALADLTYPTQVDNPARIPYRARRGGDWQLEPGSCPAT